MPPAAPLQVAPVPLTMTDVHFALLTILMHGPETGTPQKKLRQVQSRGAIRPATDELGGLVASDRVLAVLDPATGQPRLNDDGLPIRAYVINPDYKRTQAKAEYAQHGQIWPEEPKDPTKYPDGNPRPVKGGAVGAAG